MQLVSRISLGCNDRASAEIDGQDFWLEIRQANGGSHTLAEIRFPPNVNARDLDEIAIAINRALLKQHMLPD